MRLQCGHSRCLGVLAGTATLIPPTRSVWQEMGELHILKVAQTTTSISLCSKPGVGMRAVVPVVDPTHHAPLEKIWSERKREAPRRASQPRDVA